MTTNKQPIDLPTIPTLPPIEMPEASSFMESSRFLSSRPPLTRSSTSLLSQDTFMTADSSSFNDSKGTPTTNDSEPSSATTPESFASSNNLRKSMSVDSPIKHRHQADSASRPGHGNRPTNTNGSSNDASIPRTGRPPATSNTPAPAWRDRDKQQAGPSRSRGTSFSSTTGDESYFDESDMERTEDLDNVVRKGKSTLGGTPAPGELALASRLQASNSSQPPQPIVPDRSSSLTHKLKKQRSLMSVNTHLPLPQQASDITIAVVGTLGCGKSTIIRKGLKSYGLSEATTSAFPPGGTGETFPYVYRVGRITYDRAATDRLLRVLEVDISALDLAPNSSHGIFPEGAPAIDGLVVCYETSEELSFSAVEEVLQSVDHLKLPTIVFACKSDLRGHVDPDRASSILKRYDVGLIEVTTVNASGKDRIRKAFDWIFKAVFSDKQSGGVGVRDGYRNPASPAILTSSPPWDISRASSATPTASSSIAAHSPLPSQSRLRSPRLPPASEDSPRTPRTPLSPTRTRSMSDLLSERDRQDRDWEPNPPSGLSVNGSRSRGSSRTGLSTAEEALGSFDETNEATRSIASRESRPPPWMTLEELLDKLMFLAVSDDDPTFISHFLLTYRRFATPRNILLAMQKRMRALDQPTGDPMFACFAQMRICWLLDHWIQLYPADFAVPGTAGALSALVKSIIGKTYLLHYGSEFIPFMETLSTLKDRDASWAMKVEDPNADSDDSSSVAEALTGTHASPISSMTSNSLPEVDKPNLTPSTNVRERKPSLPLSAAKILTMASSPTHAPGSDAETKFALKQLLAISDQVKITDPTSIAYEITRVECGYFLDIKPRHWLQHVIGRGPKGPDTDPVIRYNLISNHIAEWVVSLILCHDKGKPRARMIHTFVEIAGRLRNMNNYSALRAVVAGINGAALDADITMGVFKSKNMAQYKQLQSYDQLLQATRAHSKYRMALRNSKGPCIPALEVHLSDLIRAHEANVDFQDDDPNKIHWAKFNMMGRFIDSITACQQSCCDSRSREDTARENAGYVEHEDSKVRELLLLDKEQVLMPLDMQEVRRLMDAPKGDEEGAEDSKSANTRTKMFFW